MARSEPTSNTYEEAPDELKELLERTQNNTDQVPASKPEREVLLRQHGRSLRCLEADFMPPRNFILPLPYLPSKTTLSQTTRVHLNDLNIDSRKPNHAILFRTIAEPYVYSNSITIVEDEHGDVARLTICNLEDSMNDPIIPMGSILAVKQPCWSAVPRGGYHIRVDHPSDIAILDPTDETVLLAWRNSANIRENKNVTLWKKEGDTMFLEKRFRKALECYEYGRLSITDNTNTDDAKDIAYVDIYRKRCNVNLILLRFDAAAEDLAQAISIHAQSDAQLQDSELVNYSTIKSWIYDHSVEDSLQIASQLPRALRDLAARIKFDLGIYQKDSKYDLALLSSYVSPLSLHIDAASYVKDTEVKNTPRHGRGLFAKRDFKAGDLVIVEKAFAFPAYLVNDQSSSCSLYSLGDSTAADRAGALLFKELVQKLHANPSARKPFFDMDDGGYWEKNGWDGEHDDIPVDIFRVEHIRRRNCFAAPLRAVDVFTNPATAIRNGFWVHTSYINHSCLPNTVRTFLGDILLLRATRDISIGDEITAQYITPELTFEERQQKFKGTWGFECDCHLCEADKKAGMGVNRDRMSIFEELKHTAQRLGDNALTATALKKFTKRLKDLELLYSEDAYAHLPKLCLVHPTLFLTEAWRGLKNMDRMIESATKLLRNFGIDVAVKDDEFVVSENAGIVNVECVRALKYLDEGYEAKGQHEVTSAITATAELWFRVITGTDVGREEFLQL